MWKLIFHHSLLAAALLLCPILRADTARADETNAALWFPVGEGLVYGVYWGFIPVGESIVSTEWINDNGRKLLAIRIISRSNKVFRQLYPVEDFVESIIDPGPFLPVRFTKNLREGSYRCHEVTEFDFHNLKAHSHSFTTGTDTEYSIAPDTRDIVCFMYYARQLSFRPGEDKTFRVMADDRISSVFIRPLEIEVIETDDGVERYCLKMEPEASFQGIFLRKGRMWIWLATQDPRVITKIVAQIPIATIRIFLEEIVYNQPSTPKAQAQ